MANRIINQYGALSKDTPVAREFQTLQLRHENELRDFITKHDLDPDELRSVHSCISMDSVVAESLLRKAFQIRQQERAGKA